MTEAMKELENRNPEIAELVKKLSETKGPLFNIENFRFENKDDGGYRVGFDGTNSWIDVNKDGVISANSGGTEDNGQLNEFINGERQIKDSIIKVNGDEYKTDSEGRVIKAISDRTDRYNNPTKISTQRDKDTQRRVRENLEGYDGGHIFANSTNGCNNTINQVPMPQYINRQGDWKKLESMEKDWLDKGKHVITEREIIYKELGSKVPKRIITKNIVEGKTFPDVIVNF
jgi:hypothetical protein